MRSQNDIVQCVERGIGAKRFGLYNIEYAREVWPGGKYPTESRFIDDGSSRSIDQSGPWLQGSQQMLADQSLRFRQERSMNANDVGDGKKFLQ